MRGRLDSHYIRANSLDSTLVISRWRPGAVCVPRSCPVVLRWPIGKICRSSVSGPQKYRASFRWSNHWAGAFTMGNLPDHGLPLVQLKEQRRDLIVALQNRNGPVSSWELMQIAAVQQAISAFEDVIADLDAEAEMEAAA